MATVARQPLAPLDGLRMQTLTSIKNRQNAISNAPVKRKASEVLDRDDSENIAPTLFSKRSKGLGAGPDGGFTKDFAQPSAFVLTKAASVSTPQDPLGILPSSRLLSTRPRSILNPKSPAARLSIKSASSSSLTAPAGRSPTRGSKRVGILSRRRIQRTDPPPFGLGAAAVPFSLDAALKGTIPNYSGSVRDSSSSSADLFAAPAGSKASWSFDIHEDTPEQEMTNLLQHGTCTLDISSDEDSEKRASRDRAEGRDKENIPPADDVSQTSASAAGAGAGADDMVFEKQRGPLAEMNVADYYPEGCDSTSVVIIPGDDEDDEAVVADEGGAAPSAAADERPGQPGHEQLPPADDGDTSADRLAPRVSLADVDAVSVDDIMRDGDDGREAKAVVALGAPEDAPEPFELWESNSAKDEAEGPLAAC